EVSNTDTFSVCVNVGRLCVQQQSVGTTETFHRLPPVRRCGLSLRVAQPGSWTAAAYTVSRKPCTARAQFLAWGELKKSKPCCAAGSSASATGERETARSTSTNARASSTGTTVSFLPCSTKNGGASDCTRSNGGAARKT